MHLAFQVLGFHIFFPCQHLICISADRVDLTVMYDEPVRMRFLPARSRIRTKTGMNKGNGRFVVWVLKVFKKCSELSHKEHSLIYDRPAGQGNHKGLFVALFKYFPDNVQPAVKFQSFLCILRLFDKCLENLRHTFNGFFAQNRAVGRHFPPSEELHAFLFHDDLKHLFGLLYFQLVIWKEKHADSVFSLSPDSNTRLFTCLFKKFVGNLEHNADTVSGLPGRIFSCPVFQGLNNL